MMKKRILAISTIAMSLLMTISCGSDDDGGGTPPIEMADFTVELVQVDELEGDFIYEGWIIVDDTPISTGTFDASEDDYTFTTVASDLAAATNFVVSIEPVPDTDPAPAATKILSGAFDGDRANLTLDEIADFATIDGNFEIFTPSDMDDMNEGNGLWFVTTVIDDMTMEESFEAGLNLPTLADGWRYEGWVVFEKDGAEVPVSTGTFTEVTGLDDAISFNGSNILNVPPFPGEDFLDGEFESIDGMTTLMFPEDGNIIGNEVFISVEPDPDTNEAVPFFVQPLDGNAINIGNNVTNLLSRNNGGLIAQGTVRR